MSESSRVRVSYILSTLNRADFLEKVLENVREYITPEDELIIVDGASSDRTAEVVGKHRDIVRLFLSEPDRGEGHALNKGALRAQGRYIKFLTDDDRLYPDAVRQAIAALQAHPAIDALYCGGEHYIFDPETKTERFWCYAWLPVGLVLTGAMRNSLWPSGFVACGVGLWLRRPTMERVGLLSAACLAVDIDYMGRLIEHGVEIRFLSVLLYRHIVYPHSQFVNRQQESRRDEIRILARLGLWEEVLEGRYPPGQIFEALKLNRPAFFERLIIFWVRYQVRKNLTLRVLAAPLRWVWKGLGFIRGHLSPARIPKSSPFDSPVWDGSLR